MAAKKGMLRQQPGRTARSKAWNSMRIMILFTAADLQATAEIGVSNLHKYMQLLSRYGYIEIEDQVAKTGSPRFKRTWRLVKDTGPLCPLPYHRNGLRDLNTGEIFTPEEE